MFFYPKGYIDSFFLQLCCVSGPQIVTLKDLKALIISFCDYEILQLAHQSSTLDSVIYCTIANFHLQANASSIILQQQYTQRSKEHNRITHKSARTKLNCTLITWFFLQNLLNSTMLATTTTSEYIRKKCRHVWQSMHPSCPNYIVDDQYDNQFLKRLIKNFSSTDVKRERQETKDKENSQIGT